MEWTEFTATMTGHLVWPSLILLLVLLFRKNILRILRDVSEWEGFGQRVIFNRNMAETQSKISEFADRHPKPTDGGQESTDIPAFESDMYAGLVRQAHDQPALTILEAWKKVRLMLFRVLGQDAFTTTGLRRPIGDSEMIENLRHKIAERGVRRSVPEAIEGLLMLRNQVAHGRVEPSAGAALSYVDMAKEATITLLTEMAPENSNNVNETGKTSQSP